MCIETELIDVFDNAEKINISNNGAIIAYNAGENRYNEILVGWKAMIETAHEMPAFGVSLDRETRKAMNSGVWVEFVFGKTYESNGMPYEKLLVNVNRDWQGFNLIRYNAKGGYDGRCFYYDLVGKNMADFSDILLNL